MNVFKKFNLKNLEMVNEYLELVNKELKTKKPELIPSLRMAMQGFELYTQGLLEVIEEYKALKEKLQNENSLWYMNTQLRELREQKDELLKEYEAIMFELEVICAKCLFYSGLKKEL